MGPEVGKAFREERGEEFKEGAVVESVLMGLRGLKRSGGGGWRN